MISHHNFRRFFLAITFNLLLVTATVLGIGTTDSWAATSLQQSINQPPIQIAAKSPIELMGKNPANSSEAKDAAIQEEERFKSETVEAMKNSIVSRDYKPVGKSKQANKEDRQATQGIKNEAVEALSKD